MNQNTQSQLRRMIAAPVILALSAIILVSIIRGTPTASSSFPLKVSSNRRYLVQADGTTAYYPIADTAWMIYWSVSREDTELYLENRRLKGFNTINTSALPMPDISATNFYGQKPFINDDMATPNDAYFAQVDWVINKAAEKGLLVLLGPAWARDYSDNLNAAKARSFGRYMGKRYKNFDNIIWFMGGDVYTPSAIQLTYAREMAAGIQEFDTRHLISYHPGGLRSSFTWFYKDGWLAFNTIQTYNPASTAAYSMLISDYNRSPVKPTWNMEPSYENENGNTPYNVRLATGWSAFSGAFGISYGSPLWRMGTIANWKNSLDLAGAMYFTNIGKAIQARAFEKLVPDKGHKMLTAGSGFGQSFASAARASDGSFGMIYLPTARAITIDMTQFNGSKTIKWFDATNNIYTTLGTFANTGIQKLPARPNNSAGQSDWLLVIE